MFIIYLLLLFKNKTIEDKSESGAFYALSNDI